MITFPSIGQFRSTIRAVQHNSQYTGNDENGNPTYNKYAPVPKLNFRGTVKLHGTNAAIVRNKDGELSYQSRERELTPISDNAGFAVYMSTKTLVINEMIDCMINGIDSGTDELPTSVAVFGEWCGGNIQKNVAITGLPKMFVIFAVQFMYTDEHSVWVDVLNFRHLYLAEHNIFNITQFGYFNAEIDFANPHLVQNAIVEMTIKVEGECPVGKYFGNSGIGEGIVWTCQEPGYGGSEFWFKVKGEAHSMKSKVTTLAPIDVEALNSLNEFADEYVSENRLLQGIDKLQEQGLTAELKNIGEFIRWVFNDIVKEEADTIVASGFDVKKLSGPIANKARRWFIEKYA